MQLQGIDTTVCAALQTGSSAAKTEHCEVQVIEFDVADSPFNVSTHNELALEAIGAFVQANCLRSRPAQISQQSENRQESC